MQYMAGRSMMSTTSGRMGRPLLSWWALRRLVWPLALADVGLVQIRSSAGGAR